MNTTQFSLAELKKAIPLLVTTLNTVPAESYLKTLDEFSRETPIFIESAEEADGLVSIVFTQSFVDYDLEETTTFRYNSVIPIDFLRHVLNG